MHGQKKSEFHRGHPAVFNKTFKATCHSPSNTDTILTQIMYME